MKPMKTNNYLSALFFFFIFSANSQNLYEELSEQLYDCIDVCSKFDKLREQS